MQSRLVLLFVHVIFFGCSTPVTAQPTWQVGNTTLTETDLVTGISLPWEILWGPDDHIWCTTRPGNVLRIDPTTGNYTTVLTRSVSGNGGNEPGMLGMAIHPDWANNPKVFIVYNFNAGNAIRERLSVFDWNGSALVNEVYLLNDIPGGWIHNGSRLIVTPDNKLLMTTGDTGDSGASSQNLSALNGKTLRLNLDGSIPEDNPYPNSYVWSYGHRNAQGLCVGPNGIIYSSEHGQSNQDEFNIIEPGRNYGWPTVQGFCNTPSEITYCEANNVREPLLEWNPCIAVNGIEYYNHPAIPEWQHCVLMAVLGGLSGNYKRLTVIHLSEDGLSATSSHPMDSYFSSFNQRLRDLCVNPYTGAVYIAFNGTSYPGSGPNVIKEFRNMNFVSVEEPQAGPQRVKVYPNPARDQVTVEFSETFLGGNYEVISFEGKLMNEGRITNRLLEINCGGYSAGSYYLRASSGSGVVTRTFLVN